VQYARQMGFEVVAIGRGADKAELARKLGAHHYVDTSTTDPAEALQGLGGATVILATASGGKAVADTLKGRLPEGRRGRGNRNPCDRRHDAQVQRPERSRPHD
jgi:propanol-preferring alcohol dehydrogenase